MSCLRRWVRSSRTGPSPACVTSCNSYFSKHLELALGRDSFEGYRRVELGVVPREKIEKLLHRRVKFTLQEPGIFDGVRMTMKADNAGIVPVPKPQVGLRCKGQEWQFFFEHELNEQVIAGLTGDSVEIEIIGNDSSGDLSRLVAKLGEIGLVFSETNRAMDQPIGTGPKITVVHEFSVDTTLRRVGREDRVQLRCESPRLRGHDAQRFRTHPQVHPPRRGAATAGLCSGLVSTRGPKRPKLECSRLRSWMGACAVRTHWLGLLVQPGHVRNQARAQCRPMSGPACPSGIYSTPFRALSLSCRSVLDCEAHLDRRAGCAPVRVRDWAASITRT